MITRIEYANEDRTRTAVIVPHDGPMSWCVMLGDRARASARVQYARTMGQCQAWARQWITTGKTLRSTARAMREGA